MGLAVPGALTGNINSGDFDKENYKGTSIETLQNPANSWFVPKAKQTISKWLNEKGNGHVYRLPLYIGKATWALIYKDAIATPPLFQLNLFYKRPESGNIFSAFTIAECAPTPVEAPLSDWSANNYQKVTTQTESFMKSCLLELDNQLPRLLKM
ncbi:hypothetical protein [Pseudocitrobacter sp. 73]|uniref:hypothetical protein n=1 Tax=Pseudocitrobacter sp. 73 TaxID=2605731 RepID=UPI0021040140|nr:hypothetical protein [Pseudocitrobacter sp. 73]